MYIIKGVSLVAANLLLYWHWERWFWYGVGFSSLCRYSYTRLEFLSKSEFFLIRYKNLFSELSLSFLVFSECCLRFPSVCLRTLFSALLSQARGFGCSTPVIVAMLHLTGQ
jgi:hypothetical protein